MTIDFTPTKKSQIDFVPAGIKKVDILSKQNDAPIPTEQFEKAKTLAYLEESGYGVPASVSDKFLETVSNSGSYENFNQQVGRQLSVDKLGPVRSSAKTRQRNVNDMIFAEQRKPISEVPAWVSMRDSRMAMDEAAIGTALIKDYLDPWVSGLGSAPGNILNSYGGMMMLFGDAVGSQTISNEGRAASRASEKFRMTGDKKKVWDEILNNDNIFKDTTLYQVLAGIGRMGGYAQMGLVGRLAIWSDVHNEIDAKVAEYTDKDTAAKYSWMISVPIAIVSNKAIHNILKTTPLASASGPRAFVGQVLKRVANKIPPSVFESLSEVSEELVPDIAFGGIDAVKANLGQYQKAFNVSIIVTGIVGVGADINIDTAQSEIYTAHKDHLTSKGFNEESAARIAQEIAGGVTDTEIESIEREARVEAIVEEEVEKEVNRPAREQALADYEAALDAASTDVDTGQSIEGIGGRPLTSIDLEILRNQPELMDDLDDSPASALLKRAVFENDLAALAEYNQMLMGVEEQVEAPAIEAPTQEAPIEPVQIVEQTDEQTLEDLEREMGSDKTEPKDYTLPEHGEVDEDGVPRFVGVSRKMNLEWNKIMADMGLSHAGRITWAETLNEAFRMGLHNRTADLKLKVSAGGQLNSTEIAAILIRKASIGNKLEYVQSEINKARDIGDMDRATELQRTNDVLIQESIELSETAREAGTENARALAAMAMIMDRRSFTLDNQLIMARNKKGSDLTTEERTEQENLNEELKAVEKEIEQLEEGEIDERTVMLDELARAHRRLKKGRQKNADKNADLKLLLKRQDKIFGLIEELNGRKPTKDEIAKAEQPDSEGYLEMINNLNSMLKEKKAGDRKVQQNLKLIEKRDALIANVEKLHRDIKETADKKKLSKLEEDIKLYKQASKDQDTIAELLRQLREGRDGKTAVTKEDVFGYKQTIQNLQKEIYRKEGIESLQSEIASLEEQLKTGEYKEKTSTPKKVDEVTKRLMERRSELNKAIATQKEREAVLEEVRTASRRIKEKNAAGEDSNADVKLVKKRQDIIFAMIDEINRGKPTKEKLKKVKNPDSEGYLEMIEALGPELKNKRVVRKLDEDIKRMEEALESGDLSSFMKSPKDLKNEPKDIRDLRTKKLALQQEINRRIADLEPNTAGKLIGRGYEFFRTSKLTMDVGHMFRQGAFNMTDPRLWFDGSNKTLILESFKSFGKKSAVDADLMVKSSPHYDLGQQAGLRIPTEGENLTDKEEIRMHGMFGRSQVAGTAIMRQTMFDSIIADYGADVTLEEAKDVAFAVNVLTGYGQYKSSGKGIEKALNVILISPRFRVSRFQAPALLLLSRDGRRIADNKILRNRIAQTQATFVASRMAIMGLAAALWPDEVKVIVDPKHWAFGRIAVETESGQWRVYNPWAGITTAYAWARKSIESGNPIEEFFHSWGSGVHPFWSFLESLRTGETYGGEKVPWYESAIRSAMPITAEGAIESAVKETGKADLVFSTIADALGVDNTLVDYEDLERRDAPNNQEIDFNKMMKEIQDGGGFEGWFGR